MSESWWIGVLQVVVAAAGVVVATLVSVHVARGERQARERGFEQEALRRAEESRATAASELLAAVTLLSQAAFERDALTEARLRVESGRHLAQSAVHLEDVDDPFLRWVGIELSDIGEGLNDREILTRVPRHGDRIQWKCGHLIDFIMVWLKRVKAPDFFAELPHIPLERTVPAKGFRDQP